MDAGSSSKYFARCPMAPLITILSYPKRNPPSDETAVAINNAKRRRERPRDCLIKTPPGSLIDFVLTEEKEIMVS